jgi:hypothetical protein
MRVTTANSKTRPAMHELPRELGNSLRSFRNSVHGERDLDLEKLELPDDLNEGEGKRHVRETSSSLILVRRLATPHGPKVD